MMRSAEWELDVSNDNTIFVVRFEGNVYRCAVSPAALYELCKWLDPALDRIDAYVALKARIHEVILRLMEQGWQDPPEVLEWEHVLGVD